MSIKNNLLECTLRPMNARDVIQLEQWERCERPYPWTQQQFLDSLASTVQHGLVWENTSALDKPGMPLTNRPGSQDEKGILAFAVVQTVLSEAYLLNVMVKAGFRERGIGYYVMRDLEKWVKKHGASVMVLDVDENNIAAIALYEKIGFKVVQFRSGAYPRGEPALTMRKEL